jgi:hypothetical protein
MPRALAFCAMLRKAQCIAPGCGALRHGRADHHRVAESDRRITSRPAVS